MCIHIYVCIYRNIDIFMYMYNHIYIYIRTVNHNFHIQPTKRACLV